MYLFASESCYREFSENPDISAFLTRMIQGKVQDVRGFESPMLHHKKSEFSGFFFLPCDFACDLKKAPGFGGFSCDLTS